MTYDEAVGNPIDLAIWEFENAINGTEADNSEYPNYCIHINEYKTALAALKTCTVEPSKPARLDENGLMPCGCGGRAFVYCPVDMTDVFVIRCEKCRVGITFAMDLPRAKKEWNTAMGWRVEG